VDAVLFEALAVVAGVVTRHDQQLKCARGASADAQAWWCGAAGGADANGAGEDEDAVASGGERGAD
jgi:hypothetical protein